MVTNWTEALDLEWSRCVFAPLALGSVLMNVLQISSLRCRRGRYGDGKCVVLGGIAPRLLTPGCCQGFRWVIAYRWMEGGLPAVNANCRTSPEDGDVLRGREEERIGGAWPSGWPSTGSAWRLCPPCFSVELETSLCEALSREQSKQFPQLFPFPPLKNELYGGKKVHSEVNFETCQVRMKLYFYWNEPFCEAYIRSKREMYFFKKIIKYHLFIYLVFIYLLNFYSVISSRELNMTYMASPHLILRSVISGRLEWS